MSDEAPTDEGTLDPWVAAWIEEDPNRAVPFDHFEPEMLALARGPQGGPPTKEIATITDEVVGIDGREIPIRIYEHDAAPTGVVVYFHGGGFVIGSIGLMDNVAREIAHWSGAVVVSVEYRLAPENPYPAGLDDCVAVTRWAQANASRFGVDPAAVAVAGESAGGNLSAAVALRLRDAGDSALAAQALLYPGTSGRAITDSMREFDGLILSLGVMAKFNQAYTGGRDLDNDPYATPLSAESLAELPPAFVLLGGSDLLRDEGRAYAHRLDDAGVDLVEKCYPGQPHGFLNFDFPAAAGAFEDVGTWLRTKLTAV
jgi:acetyl esterase